MMMVMAAPCQGQLHPPSQFRLQLNPKPKPESLKPMWRQSQRPWVILHNNLWLKSQNRRRQPPRKNPWGRPRRRRKQERKVPRPFPNRQPKKRPAAAISSGSPQEDEAAGDAAPDEEAAALDESEAPTSSSAMKRPAALRRPAAAAQSQRPALKATKYMYHKDQKWGCKLNGKEQLTVGFGAKLFGSSLA